MSLPSTAHASGTDTYDVVVVGGGIGGASVATVLQRAGYACLVLEATSVFPDRTKGEWIAPWGVAEADRLGIRTDLATARGHILRRHVGYGDHCEPAAAEATSLDLSFFPGVEGPMTQRHPDACQCLLEAARLAGAHVCRGVTHVDVVAGSSPSVSYHHDGAARTATCRLVVGADGRNSLVRRHLGFALHKDPPHHCFSGLLVDGAEGWPEDTQTLGTVDEVHFVVFPQGSGRVRLYLACPLEQKRRMSGRNGPPEFLRNFARISETGVLPGAEAVAGATPISPCATYESPDTWMDEPFTDGVVLIGDAAGWNDPILGQGLSITLTDVRLVTDIMISTENWSADAFRPYGLERAERMRRLRFSAGVYASIFAEFGDEARQRRIGALARMESDPSLKLSIASALVGPDLFPAEAFTDSTRQQILCGS